MGRSGLLRAGSLDGFARTFIERFVGGASWMCFCAHPELWGVVLFGRPDREDALQMTRAFSVELSAAAAVHDSLIDASELQSIDTGAFATLEQFARQNLERSRRKVRRVAFVLPKGVSGAVVAGFYSVLGAPFDVEYFSDRRAALVRLGQPHEREDDIGEALAELQRTPPLVGTVRALIRERLDNPDIAFVAGQLGISARTLQRKLAESGSTFANELRVARVEVAKLRLTESDDPVTVIGLDLGYSSPQHFSRQFRSATGSTPTEWRARRR